MDRQWFLAGNEVPPKTKQKQWFVNTDPLLVRQAGVGARYLATGVCHANQ